MRSADVTWKAPQKRAPKPNICACVCVCVWQAVRLGGSATQTHRYTKTHLGVLDDCSLGQPSGATGVDKTKGIVHANILHQCWRHALGRRGVQERVQGLTKWSHALAFVVQSHTASSKVCSHCADILVGEGKGGREQ